MKLQKNDNIYQTDLYTQCKFYQNSSRFLCKNIQSCPNSHVEMQGTHNNQNNLEKEAQPGGHTLSYFNTYYKVTVIKTVWEKKKKTIWYWNKDRHR